MLVLCNITIGLDLVAKVFCVYFCRLDQLFNMKLNLTQNDNYRLQISLALSSVVLRSIQHAHTHFLKVYMSKHLYLYDSIVIGCVLSSISFFPKFLQYVLFGFTNSLHFIKLLTY